MEDADAPATIMEVESIDPAADNVDSGSTDPAVAKSAPSTDGQNKVTVNVNTCGKSST